MFTNLPKLTVSEFLHKGYLWLSQQSAKALLMILILLFIGLLSGKLQIWFDLSWTNISSSVISSKNGYPN
ncbi:MAG: lysis protein [Cunavirus faecihabitans]|uniref:Lysis protein n=1 Tax=Leviviridae sp. TaxID=2027243 RepID=A0ABY3SS86_9VIRU|nr:MAG: lysis protein [Leviviridae sp.]